MMEVMQFSKTHIEKLLKDVEGHLSGNQRIRRKLPDGRIHIDRALPFLCVYRQLASPDQGTRRLVMGEASYVTVTGSDEFNAQLKDLVVAVVKTASAQFGAFLILELWAAEEDTSQGDKGATLAKPTLRIFTGERQYGPLSTVISKFEIALAKIKILKVPAKVEAVFRKKVAPPDFAPLLTQAELKKYGCHLMGLEVQPVYRNQNPDRFFPLVLQKLHRGISRALKQAFFEFAQSRTSQRPANYQTLGPRAMVKAVWEADNRLAKVSSSFDFLLLVTPVNVEAAWIHFRRSKFEKSPTFYYRPLPMDPVLVKQELYGIPIEKIEDPTLQHLFREKQLELDQKLTMLTNRGSRKLLYGCLQLYGDLDPTLVALARDLLRSLPTNNGKEEKQEYLSAAAFAKCATKEISIYKKAYPSVSACVEIRDDISGNMFVGGNLLIGNRVRVPKVRAEALIQHEIGTHMVTYYNGRTQPFKQLVSGMAGYEELQEGLAVLAEYFVGGLTPSRLRVLAGRVMAVKSLTDGKSFKDTFRLLVDELEMSANSAFLITMRAYRGGGLTKDIVYLRGLVNLMKYLRDGGDLEPIFLGKMAVRHIPVIKELLSRKVLKPAMIRPRYMDFPEAKQKLERVRSGISVSDLT
jgi:uncharacterized protein (TIGR02421 family)